MYDFTRYTPLGHRWLMRGFDEIEFRVTAGPGEALRWAVDYFLCGLTSKRSWDYWSRSLTRVASSTESFVAAGHLFDGAGATAFLGRRREAPLAMSELTGLYRGTQNRPTRTRSGSRTKGG